MANGRLSGIIEHLRGTPPLRDGAGLSDGQLLENYLGRRDEAALAALVFRHGPMVWNVCRRVLRNHHDAEDAFQATFLVFVRKAASIASRELLANWLYGVAYKTSMKARGTEAKRRGREKQIADIPEPAAAEQELWHELLAVLDQALSRLPDKYRAVIVLCDLDGKTRKEAARQLGVPEGTIASRVATGRALLAKRLTRHGLALSGEAAAVMLARKSASASVPAAVESATIQAASLFAAGHVAATGVISPKIVALTQGVLKAMLITKLKIPAAVILFVLVSGTAFIATQAQEGKNDTPAPKQSKENDKPKEPLLTAEAQEGKKDAPAPKQVKEDDKPKDAIPAKEPALKKLEAKYEGMRIEVWITHLQKAKDAGERQYAARAIMAFGADAGPAVPAVLEMLDDHSASFRNMAEEIFRVIGGPAAKTTVPALVNTLKAGHARYPAVIIGVIGNIGPEAKDAVPVLIQSLQDKSLSASAIVALCNIGPSAKEAVPAIGRIIREARLGKNDISLAESLPSLLAKLGEASIPLIAELLEENDDSLKSECASALGVFGPAAKRIAPKLEVLLKHNSSNVRVKAAVALWRIEKHSEAIPMLVELLKKQNDRSTVALAAEGLGEIGPDAKEALPELKKLLDRPEVGKVAAEAIGKIEPDAEKKE